MNENQKVMLLKWRARCKRSQIAHNYNEISFRRFHMSLGVMLIVLTTFSSVLIFANFPNYPWLPATVSIAATIFAAFQTFMKFSERADIHKVSARRYGEIKKEIEFIINFDSDADTLSKRVESIRQKESDLSQESPNTISYNRKRAKEETLNENDGYSIRNNT
ncbi:DUF4231 domain-containing protein [Vibrio parahaemolyticus]|uniref:SLATT domain-containing protein n=1 Tax=Vibrio parahaemolyticus TaxID=670 RepID=UPI00111CF18D|nr:SLATT domain-containing protein [Vibrio parahaemolyticus]TNZ66970.1 DUF4231 domain-containing protein [Vibrio parahaemolyticus]